MEQEDFEGIIESLVTTSEQSLKINSERISSINEIKMRFSMLMTDPGSVKTAEKQLPILLLINKLSNKYDDFYLDALNLLIERDNNQENWFQKNSLSQQTTSTSSLYNLKNIYNNKITTSLFSNKTVKSNEYGSSLRENLLKYRNELILTIADTIVYTYYLKKHYISINNLNSFEEFDNFLSKTRHPYKIQLLDIYKLLTKSEKIALNGKAVNWNQARFKRQPLVGAITTLTLLRNDIRHSQLIAAKLLLSEIDMPFSWMNKHNK